ncbi:transaldolase family protein [Mahella sp.]|uniref:transaldolase family protein n=1 Tax=Mahella sp. TaxID=2798721 RepID=UPI0025C4BBED|nr:transaldolase family protein [Mahella sp.]MBZ4666221.1 transaldolase [Mahella sp.]
MAMDDYKSPLHKMASTMPTDFWNDSCSVEELTYAIENGAVGATTNPVIVFNVLKKEMHLWQDRINQIIEELPKGTEEDVAWKLIEEMAVKGAELLKPVFDKENGLKGRISIQTNPKYYRNAEMMAEQAIHFNTLAPNMQVKIPVTEAGIAAIEEATYNGVNINATVCFTVPQSLAVAEAVERGLSRREKEGKDVASMRPVCTIMVGRLDDWLKDVANKDGILATPGYLDWAGIAAIKKAYKIYKERGYRTRLLAAAYRNYMQWSELMGGDIVLTIPYKWQRMFNASDIEVASRMNNEVDRKIIDELYAKFQDFHRAYDADGMKPEDFDGFGATKKTLKSFIEGYEQLLGVIRGFMITI